jgi:hypothetical protein
LQEVKELFIPGQSEGTSEYNLKGHWSKIRYGQIEGFVFDGYLSSLPPMKFITDKNGNEYVEGFTSYMDRVYHEVDSTILRDSNSDLREKRIQYENGASYEENSNVGWYEEILILPGANMNDGFLIFHLINNVPEVITLPDGEKMEIVRCGSQCVKFQRNKGGEQFEIYQFGSTLVIRCSDSC